MKMKKMLCGIFAGMMCLSIVPEDALFADENYVANYSYISQNDIQLLSDSEAGVSDYQMYLADYLCENSTAQSYIKRKYYLPYRTYVEERRESQTYQVLLAAWKVATFDGKIIEGVAEKEVGYYETVLYDTLCGGTEGVKELNDVSKIVKSVEAGTVSKILNMYSGFEENDLCNVVIGSDRWNEICDTMRKLNGLSDAFKVIDKTSDILNHCKNAYEVIEKVSTLQVLLNEHSETKKVLQDISDRTDNEALKKACSNMIEMSDNTIPEGLVDTVFLTEYSVNQAMDKAFGKLWDTVVDDLITKGYGMAVKVGQKSGKLASNLLFSANADVEHVYSMNALYEFEDDIVALVKKYEKQYLNNKTPENARLFNEAYKLMMKTYMEGIDYSKKYLEITNEEGFINKIFKKYEAENYKKFKNIMDESRKNYEDYLKYLDTGVYDMWQQIYKESLVDKTGLEYFNGHTYKIFDTKMSWTAARDYCESQGGYLVSITSSAEQRFIEDIIVHGNADESYSMGLYKYGNTWKWCDGSSYSYSNWLIGQPDNDIYIENANECTGAILACSKVDWPLYRKGEIHDDVITFGYWNDRDESANEFICEWDNEIGKEKITDTKGNSSKLVSDIISLQQCLLNIRPITKENFKLMDLNSDGKINVFDLIILKRRLLNS